MIILSKFIVNILSNNKDIIKRHYKMSHLWRADNVDSRGTGIPISFLRNRWAKKSVYQHFLLFFHSIFEIVNLRIIIFRTVWKRDNHQQKFSIWLSQLLWKACTCACLSIHYFFFYLSLFFFCFHLFFCLSISGIFCFPVPHLFWHVIDM